MSIKTSTTSHHHTSHNDVVHHIASLDGIGITSILPVLSTNAKYYVGTKRGKLKQVIISEDDLQDTTQRIQIQDIDDANGKSLKPYPVFSMTSVPHHDFGDHHHYDLLTGGGDRYVTVWRMNKEGEWTVVDQLGPHTGWVKDLTCNFSTNALQSDSESINDGRLFIFSIGCNCIEIWSAIDGRYKHIHKLQIESNVEMGCTLSSDLLCLATYSGNGNDNIVGAKESYLFAGGVDGCIHRWTLHNNKFLNSWVLSAHDGRVNAIAVCQAMNVLISVGSDGYIHCREMRDSSPSEWKAVSLNLSSDAQSTQRKATSLCIVHEESKRAMIAVGTSCGLVALITIRKADDSNTVHASSLKDTSVADEEGQVIHALCSKRYKHSFRIIIGHSNGLSVWDVPIKLLQ